MIVLSDMMNEKTASVTTTPYTAARTLTSPNPQPEYFRASLFLNAIQSLLSALIAVVYLLARRTPGQSVVSALGVDALLSSGAAAARKPGPEKAGPAPPASANGTANGGTVAHAPKGPATAPTKWISPLLLRYAQVAALQSFASQLGFASLRHISYPTLILGKSCKLVPVLLMNVVLYRRRFAAYKYVVVGLVTLGISLFMLFAEEGAGKKKKGAQTSSAWGLALLTANLLLDGATNSTQDEVFARYRVSGGQMMLCMNALATLLMAFTLVVPVPQIPLINPKPADATELSSALAFIARHPEVTRDMLTYCMAGALGQVAIFETLEKFGSLTLVSITVRLYCRLCCGRDRAVVESCVRAEGARRSALVE